MDRRHDDVRRRFSGELDDVFAQIRFQRLYARSLHRVVELNLLAHHRLALDDATRLHTTGNADGNGVGLVRRLRPMHLHALGDQAGLQLFQQPGQVGQAVAPDRLAQVAQALEFIGIRKLGAAFGLQKVHRATEVLALRRVFQRGAAAGAEIFQRLNPDVLAHTLPPVVRQISSTSSRGPCAPKASVCWMSEVLEGPLISRAFVGMASTQPSACMAARKSV